MMDKEVSDLAARPHRLVIKRSLYFDNVFSLYFFPSKEEASATAIYQIPVIDTTRPPDHYPNAGEPFMAPMELHTTHEYIDGPVEGLEARVYVVEGISDKLLRYRMRSIKRLASRTVFEFRRYRWDRWLVVLYRADNTNGKESRQSTPTTAIAQEDAPNEEVQLHKPCEKTDILREKDRIRQSKRRRKQRKDKQQNQAPNDSLS